MKENKAVLVTALLVFVFVWMFNSLAWAGGEVPRITNEEAVKAIGDPDVIFIDVRQSVEWKLSRQKIKGSVREDPNEIGAWMEKYPRVKTLIFYCA